MEKGKKELWQINWARSGNALVNEGGRPHTHTHARQRCGMELFVMPWPLSANASHCCAWLERLAWYGMRGTFQALAGLLDRHSLECNVWATSIRGNLHASRIFVRTHGHAFLESRWVWSSTCMFWCQVSVSMWSGPRGTVSFLRRESASCFWTFHGLAPATVAEPSRSP